MPFTVIGNSEWTQRGLVLTQMDAQEQVNGLVTVQVEYTGPSARHDIIGRSFYQDAPPPIWPRVVNPGELVTGRLYMESRSVTRASGLTTVRANYVGALQRAGFNGYFLREQVEKDKTAEAFNYFEGLYLYQTPTPNFGNLVVEGEIFSATIFAPENPTPSGKLRRTTAGSRFVFDERIKLVEFVRVNKTASVRLPTFFRNDIASPTIFKPGEMSFNGATVSGPGNNNTDLWVVGGSETAREFGQLSFERTTPVPFIESAAYVTPSVEIVTLEYRLTR